VHLVGFIIRKFVTICHDLSHELKKNLKIFSIMYLRSLQVYLKYMYNLYCHIGRISKIGKIGSES
jgi:hypothetical protein